MKTKNFPERKNARRKSALKRALAGNRLTEAANLYKKIVPTLRDTRTKKERDAKALLKKQLQEIGSSLV